MRVCNPPLGDTRPSAALEELAHRTDLLLLQNMGPIEDLASLPFASQFLINVSTRAAHHPSMSNSCLAVRRVTVGRSLTGECQDLWNSCISLNYINFTSKLITLTMSM